MPNIPWDQGPLDIWYDVFMSSEVDFVGTARNYQEAVNLVREHAKKTGGAISNYFWKYSRSGNLFTQEEADKIRDELEFEIDEELFQDLRNRRRR